MLRLTWLSPEKRIARLTAESGARRAELFHAMQARLENASMRLQMAGPALTSAISRRTENAGTQMSRIRERLEVINPLRVLARGYAMVTDKEGRIVTGTIEAQKAEHVRIRFADGTAEATVTKNREAGL